MKHTDDGTRAWQGVTSTGVVKGALALTLAASIAATPAVAFAAPALSTAQAETAAATAADQDAQYGATVTLANGGTENFDWIVRAVEAINADTSGKYDDATLTFNKSVPSHPTYTLNKRVTVTSTSMNYVFGGTLVLTADGSTVKGMHFALNGTKEYDGFSTRSIQVKGASNVTIEGNIFDITSQANAAANTQFNSIWVEDGSDDLTVTGNEFNIAAHDNERDWQAINLVGNSKVIEGAKVTGNTLNAVKGTDAANGAVMFMVANGNVKGSYGIKDIEFTGNKVYNKSDISRLDSKIYGLAVRSVSGVAFMDNLFDYAYMPLSYSAWNGSDEEPLNTGIVTSGNDMGTSSYSYLFKQGTIAEGGITLGAEKSAGLNGSAKSFPAGIATADGVKGYTSVQAAIDVAEDGATVQLLDIKTSIDESITVPEGKKLTLDLAGRTLWNTEGKHTIVNKGTLVITDSSTGKRGTVNNISNGRAAVVNYAGATVTLKGGNYTRSEEKSSLNDGGTTSNGGNSYYVLKNFGTMNIEDGATVKFSDSNAGYESSLVANGWYSSSDTDGDDVNAYGKGTATLNIKGGSLTGGKIVVKNDDYGVLNMTGGTLTQPTERFYGLYTVNDATVTGGTITAPKTAVGIGGNGQAANGLASKLVLGGTVEVKSENGPAVTSHDNATVRITGGTYAAGTNSTVTNGKGSIVISGGSFNVEPAADELAPGFSATKADDGSFTVQTAENAVATVALPDGTVTGYESLAAAVAAANEADDATVTLLKDVFDHSVIDFEKRVTFQAAEDSGATFNGTVRLKASGSKVTGITFLVDGNDIVIKNGKFVSGIDKSIEISGGADGVEVVDNTFNIVSMAKGEVDFQLNSIWISSGSNDSHIHQNQFYIGRTHNNSAVGVNLVGNPTPNVIDGTKIEENDFTTTADAEGVTSGNAMFVVANGNDSSADGYGVTNLTVRNNTVNGAAAKSYGVSIGDVKGLTLEGNAFNDTYMGLSYSTWGATYAKDPATGKWIYDKLPASSADITLRDNKFPNNTAAIYFNAQQLVDGTATIVVITPKEEFTYEGSQTISTNDVAQYRENGKRNAPIAPTGLVFAGWYTDEALSTPLGSTMESGSAYAKFVPVSSVIKVMGNALRMDGYVNGDGTVDYTKTALRFRYNIVAPEHAKLVVWKWASEFKDASGHTKTAETVGKNQREPNADEIKNGYDTGIVSNIVFKDIDSGRYDELFKTSLTVTYTTADGTSVSVADEQRQRSVKGLAQQIVDSPQSDADKTYAQGILDQLKTAN